MGKTKYILSAIAGFLAIFAIGLAGVYGLKAKRSTAPEAVPVDLMTAQSETKAEQTPTTPQTEQTLDARLEKYRTPAEAGSTAVTFADLPMSLQSVFKEYRTTIAVYKVEYTTAESGFRLEQDVAKDFNTLTTKWKNELAASNQLVAIKTQNSELVYSAKVGDYKVVFTFSKLTSTTTGQTIRAVLTN